MSKVMKSWFNRKKAMVAAADSVVAAAVKPDYQTLSDAGIGCWLKVTSMVGADCEELRNLGFCEQLKIKKIAQDKHLLCSLCGSKVALSKHLAEQIRVEEELLLN